MPVPGTIKATAARLTAEVIVLVMARTTAASIARAATIAERAAVRRFLRISKLSSSISRLLRSWHERTYGVSRM